METIEITTEDGQKFIFSNAEISIIQEQKITNIANDILGGWEKSAELDSAINEAFERHLEYNKEMYGEEFNEFQKSIRNNVGRDEPEYLDKMVQFINNKHYGVYRSLLSDRAVTRNIAWMQVMCISPKHFNFLSKDSDYLLKLWSKVAEKKILSQKKGLKISND